MLAPMNVGALVHANLALRALTMAALLGCRAEGSLPAEASAAAGGIVIDRHGSQATSKGPAERFTGNVTVVPLFVPNEVRRETAAYVTFDQGARSAWHSHPAGQTLVVTEGIGWVQEEGGEKREIKPGDVVWTPPGVKHWHGATSRNAMTHMAIQEDAEGKGITWLQHVTDAEYER